MVHAAVVFDFDGTIALGSGPLTAYARCVGDLAGDAVARACSDAIAEFEAGNSAAADAYAAVRLAAVAHGVDDATLSRAYLASRELLATDDAPIRPPAGLAAFLAELSTMADCIVATNAPAIGLDRALTVLGVKDMAAQVHASVGKPAGLDAIVRPLLAAGPVLAVGDIWENDLAPAQRLGADTALVGLGHPGGVPTLRGADLAELYPQILDWAARHTGGAADGATAPGGVTVPTTAPSTAPSVTAYAER